VQFEFEPTAQLTLQSPLKPNNSIEQMPRNKRNKKTRNVNNNDINNNTPSSTQTSEDSSPEPQGRPPSPKKKAPQKRQSIFANFVKRTSSNVPSNDVSQSQEVVQAVAPQSAIEQLEVQSDVGDDSPSDVGMDHDELFENNYVVYDADDNEPQEDVEDKDVKLKEVTHFFNNTNLREKYITPIYKSTLETVAKSYKVHCSALRTIAQLMADTGFRKESELDKINAPLKSFMKPPKLNFEEDIANELQQKVNEIALRAAREYTAMCIKGYELTHRKHYVLFNTTVHNINETLREAVSKTLTDDIYSEEHIDIATAQLVKEWKIEVKTITGKVTVELNEIEEKKRLKAKRFEERKEIIKDPDSNETMIEMIDAAIERRRKSSKTSNDNTSKKTTNPNKTNNPNNPNNPKNPNNPNTQGYKKKKKRSSHKKVANTINITNNPQDINPPLVNDEYHHHDNNLDSTPSRRGKRGKRFQREGDRMHLQGGPLVQQQQHQQLHPPQQVLYHHTAQMQPIPYHYLPQYHQPYMVSGMQYYPIQPQYYSYYTQPH
jgi:hypothetical protein